MRSHIVTCPECRRRNRLPPHASGQPVCHVCHSPLPWVVEATETDFDELTAGDVPVLVDLWAPWCGPCVLVGPAVEAVAGQLAGRIKLVKLDVDRAPSIAQRFAVRSIPTLLLLHDGRETARWVGTASSAALIAWLQPRIAAPAA